MPRPIKWRRVGFIPEATFFKPAGIPVRASEQVCLAVEEIEAIRLKDLESLEQEQCAERMNVSRPTFQRVLASGRRKLADALVNGKAIRIEGGNFEMESRRFRCLDGHEWEVPFDAVLGGYPEACPTCDDPNVVPTQPWGFGFGGRGRGRGRLRRHGR